MFERLINLAWQFLHDGARTLRATELWLALAKPSGQATPPEQESLLRERIRVLHRYGNLTKRHGQAWPPIADGHKPWPAEGCGTFPGKTSAGANSRRRGHGGWQTTTAEATERWGGEDRCTIRVLSFNEWDAAAPECLAALFTRPFLVTSGAVSAWLCSGSNSSYQGIMSAFANNSILHMQRSNRRSSSIAGTQQTSNISASKRCYLEPLLVFHQIC